MKRGLMIVLGILLIFSCAKKVSKTYDGKTPIGPDYQIAFPADWQILGYYMGADNVGLTPADSDEDAFFENITIVLENVPTVGSLEKYYDLNLESMKSSVGGFEIIESGDVMFDKIKMKKVVYKMVSGDLEQKNIVYFTLKGGSGYSLTLSMTVDSFDTYSSLLEEVAGTFRFK